MSAGVPPERFYQNIPTRERGCSVKRTPADKPLPKKFVGIFKPSPKYEAFKKQGDAISFAQEHNEGLITREHNLMVFAFQRYDGSRGFLVAHPELFWHYDSKKSDPADRRTCEVIIENEPCKLYLDLEFDRSCNPDKDGVRMTNTFISVLCGVLKREFNVECDKRSVLDLDSTTDVKFSRHLIFQMDACFRNNYHVGSFIRMVCHEVQVGSLSGKDLKDVAVPVKLLDELFVKDKKGNRNIFCDQGVYTKNRHFRLYKSTKWKKNAPLCISEQNMYQIRWKKSDKEYVSEEQADLQVFLDSLVTYFPSIESIKILEVSDSTCSSYHTKNGEGKATLPSRPIQSDMSLGCSPVPFIDTFIEELVHPGRIRRWAYFIKNKSLDYDIVGNRYCHNIGRAHKSNNVKYVVDLNRGVYYQKCYDSDCANYRSLETSLPEKLLFLISDDIDAQFSEVSSEDMTEVWESVYALLQDERRTDLNSTSGAPKTTEDSFPEYGLSDSDLLNFSANVS